jgi:multiple sugar transport system substrate-binding protein
MERKHWLSSVVFVLFVASLVLTACAPAAAPSQAPGSTQAQGAQSTSAPAQPSGQAVTIRYVLWDSAQQPAYQACATAFTAKNPNITIKIDQSGWGDYWTAIQTGFVSGDAPDVFTDHLAKFPEFANKGQLVDLAPLAAQDKVDTGVYIKGLADLWVKDGKRYGLPKDWDTIAVFYNKDMFTKAGVDPAVMKDWTWNPKDGGTFEQTVAKLTLDKNGKNGLDPAFDKSNVVQYGFIPQGGGSGVGQTQWSMFAVSDGWTFNAGPWATKYNYDDPKLAETMTWYASLSTKGYAPKEEDITSLGGDTLFTTAKGAMTTEGSWNINNFITNAKFGVGFGLLPVGPQGRKSMFNGLADSIWVGSKHIPEAWAWVKFAASAECENIVGDTGVVFPAIQSGVDKSLAKHTADKVDASAFTQEALDPNGTFLFPIADHASEVDNIMNPAMESIMLHKSDAATTLKTANDQVNALFK